MMKYLLYLESLNLFSDYIKQIQNGEYKECTEELWEDIQIDGFCEEVNNYEGDFNKENYSFIILRISEEDKLGLINNDPEIVEKYNQFDIYLKDNNYYPKYLDMINYDTGQIYIIKHEKFNEKNSEYYTENGKPKSFYHYSDNLFSEFKGPSDIGHIRKHSLTNQGIYFLPSVPMYKYGKNKYEVYLKIRNPFIIDNGTYISDVVNPYTNKRIEVEHISSKDIKYLTENGYDSVIAKYPSFQTVVFNKEQIKIIKINDKEI